MHAYTYYVNKNFILDAINRDIYDLNYYLSFSTLAKQNNLHCLTYTYIKSQKSI